MKKVDAILSADIHAREDKPVSRTDSYWEAQAKKLKWLSDLQKKHGCPILDAGDPLNTHRVSPFLEQYLIKNIPNEFITVMGNPGIHNPHYSKEAYEKSSIAVLEASGAIRVLKNDSFFKSDNLEVTGITWGTNLVKWLSESDRIGNILLFHTMCYQGRPPYPGADKEGGTALSLLKKYPDFDLIVTGHNHQSFVQEHKGRILVNPGSMMRMTADQDEHRPCVYLWYAESNTVEPVYYPIEKGVISREHLDKVQERDERMEAFVEQLRTDTELGLSFEGNMEKFLAANEVDAQVKNLIGEAMNGQT